MRRIIDRLRSMVRQGRYVLTSHAIGEMAADGLTETDVEQSVLSGRIVNRQKDRFGRRKYAVEGRSGEGRLVRTVCRYSDAGGRIVVITVYEVEEE